MRSVNKVIIIGNLTRDPEMRQTPNGQSVTTFGVATNREWATKDKERKSSAEFHECVAWANLAEICEKYLVKGNLVYIEGYLKTRSWETEEGIKKFKTEIVIQDMIRLEKRKDINGEGEYVPAQGGEETAPAIESSDTNGNEKEEEEKEEDDEEKKKKAKKNKEKKVEKPAAETPAEEPAPAEAGSDTPDDLIEKDLGL